MGALTGAGTVALIHECLRTGDWSVTEETDAALALAGERLVALHLTREIVTAEPQLAHSPSWDAVRPRLTSAFDHGVSSERLAELREPVMRALRDGVLPQRPEPLPLLMLVGSSALTAGCAAAERFYACGANAVWDKPLDRPQVLVQIAAHFPKYSSPPGPVARSADC